MKHISTIILPVCEDLGLEEKLTLREIEAKWHIMFSSPLSLHACPIDLKKGELTINVDSPAWLQQLKYMQVMIIQKLCEYRVKSIKLRIGKVKKTQKQDSTEGFNTSKPKFILPEKDMQWIDNSLSTITDSEIKESVKKAVEKSLIYKNKIARSSKKG